MPTKSKSSSSITMPNALTIRSIDGVKDFLIPLLNVGGTVVLEVGDDAQVDLSFVQVAGSRPQSRAGSGWRAQAFKTRQWTLAGGPSARWIY